MELAQRFNSQIEAFFALESPWIWSLHSVLIATTHHHPPPTTTHHPPQWMERTRIYCTILILPFYETWNSKNQVRSSAIFHIRINCKTRKTIYYVAKYYFTHFDVLYMVFLVCVCVYFQALLFHAGGRSLSLSAYNIWKERESIAIF